MRGRDSKNGKKGSPAPQNAERCASRAIDPFRSFDVQDSAVAKIRWQNVDKYFRKNNNDNNNNKNIACRIFNTKGRNYLLK